MALTQEQKDKIAEWRRSKGIENCIACGFSGEMRYGDVVALPIVGFSGQTVIVDSGKQTIISGGQTVVAGSGGRVVIGGEEVSPLGGMVPIACPNCGYTMLFSEEVLPL
jgi:predicted RNA-binding Zn-ribbon protein involved in translation (DUF1610 family)